MTARTRIPKFKTPLYTKNLSFEGVFIELFLCGVCPHCGGPVLYWEAKEEYVNEYNTEKRAGCMSNDFSNSGCGSGYFINPGVELEVMIALARKKGWDKISIDSIPSSDKAIGL